MKGRQSLGQDEGGSAQGESGELRKRQSQPDFLKGHHGLERRDGPCSSPTCSQAPLVVYAGLQEGRPKLDLS